MLRATVVPAREAAETTSNPKASIGPPAKLTVKPKGEGLASRRANRPATGAGLAAPGARNTTSLGLFGAPTQVCVHEPYVSPSPIWRSSPPAET